MEGAKEWLDGQEEIKVVTDGMVFYLSSLLATAVFDEQVKEDYFRRMSEDMPLAEYEKMEREIKAGQIDPVTHGDGYKQGDIIKHLGKLK